MKKILSVLITLLTLTGVTFAGCKGATDSHVTEDDTVIQQNTDENTGEMPAENGEDNDRMPRPAPRLPDERHGGNVPVPKPMPKPHHKK